MDGGGAVGVDESGWWSSDRNLRGQLGDGTRINSLSLVPVGTDSDWAELAAGRVHTCAIKLDGTQWGSSAEGQAGSGGLPWPADAVEVVAAP